MEDIEHYNIPIYNFPYDVEEDDEDTIEENSELRVKKITIIITCVLTST
jgi:cell division control protein 11